MKKRTNIHLHNLSVSLLSKVFLIEKYEEKGLSSYEMDSLFYNLIQTKRLCDLIENNILISYPFINEFYEIGKMFDGFFALVYNTPIGEIIENIKEFHVFEDTYYDIWEFCQIEMIDNGLFEIDFSEPLSNFLNNEYPHLAKSEYSVSKIYKFLTEFNSKYGFFEEIKSNSFPDFKEFLGVIPATVSGLNIFEGFNYLKEIYGSKTTKIHWSQRAKSQMEKQDYTYKMGLLEKYVSYRYRVGSHNPKFRK